MFRNSNSLHHRGFGKFFAVAIVANLVIAAGVIAMIAYAAKWVIG